MERPRTLSEAMQYFAAPENCHALLISVRWNDGAVRCPHCGSGKVTYLAKSRLWKCHSNHPRQKFSPKTGTVFEHGILGLDKILLGIWMVVNCKGKLSSYTLASVLQISQKSAWRLRQSIQEAMRVAALAPEARRK
jgi:transposase-like protein